MYAKISSGSASYDVIIPSDYMIEQMIDEYVSYCNDGNYQKAFDMLSADCKKYEFDNDTFNEVFRPCTVHEFRNGYIVVLVPNSYLKTRLNKLYINQINDLLSEIVTINY